MRHVMTAWLLALASCMVSDAASIDFPPSECIARSEGTWQIRATGERTGCKNIRLNGDVEILVQDLVVDAASTRDCRAEEPKSEGFAACITATDIKLTAGLRSGPDDATPVFVGVSNEVQCTLDFELTEILADGEVLEYLFEGEGAGLGWEGSFEGRGPESCVLRGVFDVDVR